VAVTKSKKIRVQSFRYGVDMTVSNGISCGVLSIRESQRLLASQSEIPADVRHLSNVAVTAVDPSPGSYGVSPNPGDSSVNVPRSRKYHADPGSHDDVSLHSDRCGAGACSATILSSRSLLTLDPDSGVVATSPSSANESGTYLDGELDPMWSTMENAPPSPAATHHVDTALDATPSPERTPSPVSESRRYTCSHEVSGSAVHVVDTPVPALVTHRYPYSTRHVLEHPSPDTVLPSSQVSYAWALSGSRSTMLLPHAAGTDASPLRSCQQRDASAGSGTEHDHPGSTPHVEEQLGKH
jgi:hypothetical protein